MSASDARMPKPAENLHLASAFRTLETESEGLAALAAATATALAMVAMGAHYFTDTVGGAAVAISVVLATALIIDKVRPPRQSAS